MGVTLTAGMRQMLRALAAVLTAVAACGDELLHSHRWNSTNLPSFDFPSTVGCPRICQDQTCNIEVHVVASLEAAHDDTAIAPLIEGEFGMVIHTTPHPDFSAGTTQFVIEIEDDPFKCGKHPVRVSQLRSGELADLEFHQSEAEHSKRFKEGMV